MSEFMASNGWPVEVSRMPRRGPIEVTIGVPLLVADPSCDDRMFSLLPSQFDALREYFATLPEIKPWEDANPGEVWALTIDHAAVRAEFGGQVACYLDDRGDFVAVAGLMRIDAHDAQIAAGRRIWPESADAPTG